MTANMPITRSKTFAGTKPSELLGLHHPDNGFLQDVKQYFGVLARTPQNFLQRSLHVHKLEDTVSNINGERKGEMVKTLNWCVCYARRVL